MSLTTLPSLVLVPFPTELYLCFSQKDWDKIKGELKLTDEEWLNDAQACVRQDGYRSIMCLDPHQGGPQEDILALMVHEIAHVWQNLLIDSNEKEPSTEFEAFYLQHISRFVFQQYLKATGKLCSDSQHQLSSN